MLLGRTTELQYLEQFYEKTGSHMVVVYGKKGVGRHSLLEAFGQEKQVSIYEARPCSVREQLYQWGCELRAEKAEMPEYPSFTDIFQQLTALPAQKRVIILHEFQYLVKPDGAFMDSIKAFLHSRRDGQHIFFILSSSALGWIENSMVTKIGDAAYRISGFLKVRELAFQELFQYFQHYSMEECVELYGILGSIPGLWQHFDRKISFMDNLQRTLLIPDGTLVAEAERQVSEELRETAVYHTILAALASGKQKLNELHRHTGFSRAKISVYLRNLMELELVEKVFSFDSAGKENVQKGLYRISSSLIHFYFRYLYPNMTALYRMSAEQFYKNYIQWDIMRYTERYFAKACREYLDSKGTYIKSGEWVGKAGVIDYIAQEKNGHTVIAGCSFHQAQMKYDDYEWLLFCAKQAKVQADEVCLFAMNDFDIKLKQEEAEQEKVHLIQWRNLYI